jgi:hypothetical protein
MFRGARQGFGALLLASPPMFDKAFFGTSFMKKIEEFSRDHDGAHVRLEVVTTTGERLDTLEFKATETGTRLSTRDERLVFLPYSLIAFIDVSTLQDRRVPGFEFSTSAD